MQAYKNKPFIMVIIVNGQLIRTTECEHGLPRFVCPKCMGELPPLDEIPVEVEDE